MPTFPSIQPTYSGFRKTSQPKVKVTKLGDGYEFRALYGLPLTQDPKVYNLTFNVSEEQSDIIEAFLRSRVNDQASFTFTPTGEGFTKTGEYTQSTTTATITVPNHGLAIGDVINITYTSTTDPVGNPPSGSLPVVVKSVINSNSFAVFTTNNATDSGTVSITLSGAGQYVCDSWTKQIPYLNRAIINCTFREVFEP